MVFLTISFKFNYHSQTQIVCNSPHSYTSFFNKRFELIPEQDYKFNLDDEHYVNFSEKIKNEFFFTKYIYDHEEFVMFNKLKKCYENSYAKYIHVHDSEEEHYTSVKRKKLQLNNESCEAFCYIIDKKKKSDNTNLFDFFMKSKNLKEVIFCGITEKIAEKSVTNINVESIYVFIHYDDIDVDFTKFFEKMHLSVKNICFVFDAIVNHKIIDFMNKINEIPIKPLKMKIEILFINFEEKKTINFEDYYKKPCHTLYFLRPFIEQCSIEKFREKYKK